MKPVLKHSDLNPSRILASNITALLCAGLFSVALTAQTPDPATPAAATQPPAQATGTVTSTPYTRGKKKVDKTDDTSKVLQSKDTKKEVKKNTKADALVGVDAKLPDKQLYDKAIVAMNKSHFDVARLDLQTMLNTYPDSQYQMRAKLAIADSWYKEGGTAALTQAESEYSDFRVFFPNAPEAAEAQMRIGDIYFRQMDKPDRDYSKAVHAEEEYRRMLTDYPNAPEVLTTQAKQRLREVQEVMASREADVASYYGAKQNYAAVIARLQTVSDTYPQYSHMDDVLVGLGDAYAAQARYWRDLKSVQKNPQAEAARAKLEQLYDGMAADYYRKVVLEHSASPHVEDARDRLAAMNLPIPEPTKEQIAASAALENSRSTYTISNRLTILLMHKPDTVLAAGMGDPSLTDPKPTVAPAVIKREQLDLANAVAPPAPAPAPGTVPAAAPAQPGAAAPAATPAAAPLAFQEVGTGDSGSTAPVSNFTPSAPVSGGSNGASVGIEIVNPSTTQPAQAAPTPADPNYGLKPVGPPDATPLPAAEKAAPAPDRPNAIAEPQPAAQVVPAGKKAPKPEFDKKDESSSRHKKKKGLKKLDPLPPL